jgi:hypothetical protein
VVTGGAGAVTARTTAVVVEKALLGGAIAGVTNLHVSPAVDLIAGNEMQTVGGYVEESLTTAAGTATGSAAVGRFGGSAGAATGELVRDVMNAAGREGSKKGVSTTVKTIENAVSPDAPGQKKDTPPPVCSDNSSQTNCPRQ